MTIGSTAIAMICFFFPLGGVAVSVRNPVSIDLQNAACKFKSGLDLMCRQHK